MSPSSVSVVIPPPTIDLDGYEPFGEVYSRTVDEILSDEASFDATFDSYTSDKAMDKAGAGRKREGRRGLEYTARHTKSPYFHTGRRAQRAASMEEHRSETEAEDEDEDEDTEEDDDAVEADIIFASVGAETRDRLLKDIVSHPFMSEGVYPVERSTRRAFVRHVRKKARSAGLDEEAIARLTRYVKKTYLQMYGNGCIITMGSEYGDEIGEGEKCERKSMELSKNDRKRKRADGEKTKAKSRKNKKASTLKTDTSSVQPGKDTEHEVIDLDPDSEDVFANTLPDPRTVKNYSVFGGSIKGRAPRTSKESKHSLKQGQQSLISSTAVEKRNRKNSIPYAQKYPDHSDSVYQDDAICLESDIDIIKKPPQIVPEATHVDSVSLKPETPDERACRLRKEKNRKKNEARKRRRAQRQRGGLKTAGTEDSAVNDTPFESQPTTKKHVLKDKETDDSQGVTPSDEVKSKYFVRAAQVDGPALSICNANSSTSLGGSMKKYWSIPEDTRALLREFDLASDFFESHSGSVLSDVSNESIFEDDNSFLVEPSLYRHRAVTPLEQSALPPIETDTSIDYPRLPFYRTLRPGLPKISPYFPKPLMNPDSCLPFPSIDAPTFGLIQEQLAHDPFRLLIATIFLNRTRGGVALPVLFGVFDQYPTIKGMSKADLSSLVSMIHCLGFQNQRAQKCISLAQTWLAYPPIKGQRYRKLHYPCKLDGKDVGGDECITDDDPRVAWEIAHLPGVGAYSLDSWRIFCRDELRGLAKDWNGDGTVSADFVPEWKSVLPQDKELRAYLTWMWLKEGWVWDRHTGERTRATEKTMRAARRGGLAHEMGGNWVLETSPVKKAVNGLTDWS